MVDYCNPLSATQQQEITKQLVVDNSILYVLPGLEKGTVSWDLLLDGEIAVYTYYWATRNTKHPYIENSILYLLPELEKGTVSWDLLLICAIYVFTSWQQENTNLPVFDNSILYVLLELIRWHCFEINCWLAQSSLYLWSNICFMMTLWSITCFMMILWSLLFYDDIVK